MEKITASGDPVEHKFSPSSAMFEMANVDTEKVFRYIQENQEDFEFLSDIVPMREFDDRLKQHYFVGQGFKKLVKKQSRQVTWNLDETP